MNLLRLLKKEFVLCLHPAVPLFLALSVLILVPNYPYLVSFFYITLGIFFICMSGRENHDIPFTVSLPVSRREMAAARILMGCCLQVFQLILCAVLIALRPRILGDIPNGAGMDANLALLGEGFLLFALFNLIFFPSWYKDVRKVGVPFLKGSAAVFLFVVADVVSTYAVPFVRDRLDTADPAFLTEKAVFLLVCAVLYGAATYLAYRLSRRNFEKQDLQM